MIERSQSRSLLFAFAVLAAASPALASPELQAKLSATEQKASAELSEAAMSATTRFLSDDLLEGRSPGTRGDQIAIAYLASELEGLGYQPGATDAAGKPSWFQPVPLVKYTAAIPPALPLERGDQKLSLATGPGDKADVVVRSLADQDLVSIKDAELVFVGYGITAPEHGWDDYKNVDVKGKIAVILNFNPPWAGDRVRLWYGRWNYKFLEAARHGAVGALLIHTDESASYPWHVAVASNKNVAFGLPPGDDKDLHLPFQAWISHDAADRVFKMAGRDLAADEAVATAQEKTDGHGYVGAPLGVRTSFEMPVKRERLESANVIGLWPGSDPKLKDQAVLYTAHHDHLGVRDPPVAGQHNVYSGAVDNASGCAAVLDIARAIRKAKPKRSVLVAFVTAEEQGLLGSRYFAAHPTIPAGKLVADINIDCANIYGKTKDLAFIGLGRSTVDPVVKAVAAAQGRTVAGDPFPDHGAFYRSDHFELARVGVPAVRVRGGPHFVGRPESWGREQEDAYEKQNYHQPSDVYPTSPASWDFSGAVQDAQLQLVVGLRLANAPTLPVWNPGDEFEAARKASLNAM